MLCFFVKYALANVRLPNQYTVNIDLLSIRISIRIISIRISKQRKHRDQQGKGWKESALSCIINYTVYTIISSPMLKQCNEKHNMLPCYFVVCVWFFIPLENFSLLSRCHHL